MSATGVGRARPRATPLVPRVVPFAAAAIDVLGVFGTTALVSLLYEGDRVPISSLGFGVLMATLFLAVNVGRHDYALTAYLRVKGQTRKALRAWSIAFLATVTILFLTKTGSLFSRGLAVFVFAGGAVTCGLIRVSLSRTLRRLAEQGRIAARTVYLVGEEAALREFTRRPGAAGPGLRIAGSAVIRPDTAHRAIDLTLAAAAARALRPNDVLILAPWREATLIGHIIDTFKSLPAAVHLGPDALLENFADMHVVRSGPLTYVRLVHTPLSPFQLALKRGFDIAAAGLMLALFAPVFAIVAVLITLDSPGPVFFLQTRYGYNREPFRIVKFRTMRTLEDGAAFRQAVRNDPRITRLGHLLRRSNVDELPQLLNVIRGDMSLVGPRPHAVAHDQAFEGGIADYSRRHNVRPGITGWAQVNGWRGETRTQDRMTGRIAADLHYVDNWSLWLDVTILVRTVLSSRAYSNAG